MSHVVGVGYVGSIEALCEKLQAEEEDLGDLLEEAGLTLFDLEDDQCFVTLTEKHQLVDGVCVTLDERTIYTPTDLRLIREYTGSTDSRLRICELRSSSAIQILEGIKGLEFDETSPLQFEDAEVPQ